MDMKAAFAELTGTFTLVFVGTATAVFAGSGILGSGGGMGILAIAFAFGFTLMVLVYAIGPISGCHVNPAVTIARQTSNCTRQMHCIGAFRGRR
jgi:aquaporin Z